MIRIIDCGSQLTQNIARRVRELGVFTEIVPYHAAYDQIVTHDLEGIIISGGQFSVYDEGAPSYIKGILFGSVPVLGICYGQQSIAYQLGGAVRPVDNREYGETQVTLMKESPLFQGIEETTFPVWMSHGDIVEKVPQGFEITARSQAGHVAGIERNGKIYAVQFHPEADHTKYGRQILDNFLDICKAKRAWDPAGDYERILAETREKIKGKAGIGGISGGVDSTTASLLVASLAGGNYHPIFVDNGLLRLHEAEHVRQSLIPFSLNVRYVDASESFLSLLQGVSDADEKRKIIGHEFIRVFKEAARDINDVSYLVQGTLYPDVVESVPIYGCSAKIKRHHNVGGLPENLGLMVVEPFRNFFKDEVRKIATEKLGLPKEIVWRHPFPGPGLAVRIPGLEVTPERLRIVREADAIFIDELRKRDLYYQMSQAFAVFDREGSTGVMGDASSYEAVVALRAVVTNDFMTADWFDFDKRDLVAIANRIINTVKGVNRVTYDVSQKPSSTIEWE